MVIINDIEARKILLSLYNVAEKDRNDVIANAASALAVRLETPRRGFHLSELEARIVHYAISNQPTVTTERKRRKTYNRRVSLA